MDGGVVKRALAVANQVNQSAGQVFKGGKHVVAEGKKSFEPCNWLEESHLTVAVENALSTAAKQCFPLMSTINLGVGELGTLPTTHKTPASIHGSASAPRCRSKDVAGMGVEEGSDHAIAGDGEGKGAMTSLQSSSIATSALLSVTPSCRNGAAGLSTSAIEAAVTADVVKSSDGVSCCANGCTRPASCFSKEDNCSSLMICSHTPPGTTSSAICTLSSCPPPIHMYCCKMRKGGGDRTGQNVTSIVQNLDGPPQWPNAQKGVGQQQRWVSSGLASSTSSCGQQGSSQVSEVQEPLGDLLHGCVENEYLSSNASDDDGFSDDFFNNNNMMGPDTHVTSECSDEDQCGMLRVPSSQSGLTLSNASELETMSMMKGNKSCTLPMSNNNTIEGELDESMGFPGDDSFEVGSTDHWLSEHSDRDYGGRGNAYDVSQKRSRDDSVIIIKLKGIGDPPSSSPLPKLKRQCMEGCVHQDSRGGNTPNNSVPGVRGEGIESTCMWKVRGNSSLAARPSDDNTRGCQQDGMESMSRFGGDCNQGPCPHMGFEKQNMCSREESGIQVCLQQQQDCEMVPLCRAPSLNQYGPQSGGQQPVGCTLSLPGEQGNHRPYTVEGLASAPAPGGTLAAAAPGIAGFKGVVISTHSTTSSTGPGDKRCDDFNKSNVDRGAWTQTDVVACSSSSHNMLGGSICQAEAARCTVSTSMPMLTATMSLPAATKGVLTSMPMLTPKAMPAISATVTSSSVGESETTLGIPSTGMAVNGLTFAPNPQPSVSPLMTMDLPQCLKDQCSAGERCCAATLPVGSSPKSLFGEGEQASAELGSLQEKPGEVGRRPSRMSEKGGKVCKVEGCGKGARGSSGLCIAHGGGRRCEYPGCSKGAEGRTSFCKAHGGGRRCQKEGCKKSAEGKTPFCIAHGGGRRCGYEGCERSARGSSGFCIRHGGGKRCLMEGCNRSAEGHSGLCISHGGGRRCQFPNCTKGAQGSTKFCKAHGGGKRCTAPGCNKGAEGKTPFCKAHGGGKRCQFGGKGECKRSVHGGTDFCVAHGGGKRCAFAGCTKSARGKTAYCVRHGGGKRCQFPGCGKSAQGSTDFCKAHGGGKRCMWGAITGREKCDRFARGRTGLCSAHAAMQKDDQPPLPQTALNTLGAAMPGGGAVPPPVCVSAGIGSDPFPNLLPLNTLQLNAAGENQSHAGLSSSDQILNAESTYGMAPTLTSCHGIVKSVQPVSMVEADIAAIGSARLRVNPGLVDNGLGRGGIVGRVGSINGLTAGPRMSLCMPLSGITPSNMMVDMTASTTITVDVNASAVGMNPNLSSLKFPDDAIGGNLQSGTRNAVSSCFSPSPVCTSEGFGMQGLQQLSVQKVGGSGCEFGPTLSTTGLTTVDISSNSPVLAHGGASRSMNHVDVSNSPGNMSMRRSLNSANNRQSCQLDGQLQFAGSDKFADDISVSQALERLSYMPAPRAKNEMPQALIIDSASAGGSCARPVTKSSSTLESLQQRAPGNGSLMRMLNGEVTLEGNCLQSFSAVNGDMEAGVGIGSSMPMPASMSSCGRSIHETDMLGLKAVQAPLSIAGATSSVMMGMTGLDAVAMTVGATSFGMGTRCSFVSNGTCAKVGDIGMRQLISPLGNVTSLSMQQACPLVTSIAGSAIPASYCL